MVVSQEITTCEKPMGRHYNSNMKKIISWVSDNLFLLFTIFFLLFIPLYPKLPLIDIKNTWVYIRAEDFFVALGLLVWFVQLVRGKVSLKTPLTLPIMIFWIFGAFATIHAVLIVFPTLANVFSNVAFLSFLRRIEYISLFFIAYSAIRDRKLIPLIVLVLTVTLLAVAAYGFGQRYLGFPAYLTMNEEYAKGVPIILSSDSRVPSTFAGHYDLAAYLVLVVPILASMIFGFRNWIVRFILAASVGIGFALMFMTVSRVSFFVLFVALAAVVFFQKRKLFFLAIPVALIFFLIVLTSFSSNLFDRFGNTLKEVDVLVDANTGDPIGHVKTVQTQSYADKLILEREFAEPSDLLIKERDPLLASASAIVPLIELPPDVIAVVPPDTSNGENLPQGTGYVNLTLAPVQSRIPVFFYEVTDNNAQTSEYVTMFVGNFLVKKALAYDLSFTTRFQGEWPHAIEAFKRNVLFGSGYSSISLAIDNNFLRILGEIGLLGLLSFVGIFVVAGVYARKILPSIESPVIRSFVVGYFAGVIGLFLNAVLIDVFEASKIAYMLWLLMGIVIGILHISQQKAISIPDELRKIAISPLAVTVYICGIVFILYYQMTGNYFIGDDFTWLRWAADCDGVCPSLLERTIRYFTQAEGFFYRPGTKVLFSVLYDTFWLNQEVYHVLSLVLHSIVSLLLFLVIRKVTKENLFAALSTLLFLFLSGYSEAVYWIAATGHLVNAVFMLLSVLLYIHWEEKKQPVYYIGAFIAFSLSLLFHELGVVVPVLLLSYKFVADKSFSIKKIISNIYSVIFMLPVLWYLILRFFAQSHWTGGDYSYNLLKLPLNAVGNAIGYFLLGLFGPITLSLYNIFRTLLREQVGLLAGMGLLFLVGILFYLFKKNGLRRVRQLSDSIAERDRRIVMFGVLFFIVFLLPFIGLGNITSRYSYLATAGVAMLLVFGFQKLYGYLQHNGRGIALATLVTIVSTFLLFHIIQTQQTYGDWREAGLRTKRFITSIDALYENNWKNESVEFHFVSVPIRVGEAWMFPVGLDDALWFVFRNPQITVYQDQTPEQALQNVTNYYSQKVFQFKDDGSVAEVRRTKTGIQVYDQ
jgi:hypothetical protein